MNTIKIALLFSLFTFGSFTTFSQNKNQHIAAKGLKPGKYTVYKPNGRFWTKQNKQEEIKLKYGPNKEVRSITIGKKTYETAHYKYIKDKVYYNTHFENSEKTKGVFIGDAFVLFYYWGYPKQASVTKTYGKPSIKPSKLQKKLLAYYSTISKEEEKAKKNTDNLPSRIYDKVYGYQNNDWRKVKHNGKYGFIDHNNKLVIPIEYDYIAKFSEGFAVVKKDKKFGFVNTKGKLVSNWYNRVFGFEGGSAPIAKDGKVGFLSKKMKENWVFTNVKGYEAISKKGNNYAIYKGNKVGLIDKDGTVLLEPKYKKIFNPKDGISCVQGTDGKWGYYKHGKGWIIERVYYDVFDFKNGKALVKHKSDEYMAQVKKGYANKNGEITWNDGRVTPPNNSPKKEYCSLRNKYIIGQRILKNHPFIVKKGKKYGLIRSNGNVLLPVMYKYISNFDCDFYFVHDTDGEGAFYNASAKKFVTLFSTVTELPNVGKNKEGEAVSLQAVETKNGYETTYFYKLDGSIKNKVTLKSNNNTYNSYSSNNRSYSSSRSSSSSSTSSKSNASSSRNSSGPSYKGSVVIKNDTRTKYYVWFGSGSGWLANGSSKTTSCKKGAKLYYSTSNKSSSKKLVFKVTPDMCGKTIKLSKYL